MIHFKFTVSVREDRFEAFLKLIVGFAANRPEDEVHIGVSSVIADMPAADLEALMKRAWPEAQVVRVPVAGRNTEPEQN